MSKLTNEQIEGILKGAPDNYKGISFGVCDAIYCSEPEGRMLSDLQEILELRKEVERLKRNAPNQYSQFNAMVAHVEKLKIALPDKVVDLVRCGIGGNYGGEYYNEALDKYYHPLVDILKQSPQTSLAEHDAEVAHKAIIDFWHSDDWEDGDAQHFADKYATKIRKETNDHE